jgi:hypothetical protein
VLVGCVAVLTEKADGRVSAAFAGDPLAHLSLAGMRAQSFAAHLMDVAATYSGDNTFLVVFGLGALGLVGLMVRT